MTAVLLVVIALALGYRFAIKRSREFAGRFPQPNEGVPMLVVRQSLDEASLTLGILNQLLRLIRRVRTLVVKLNRITSRSIGWLGSGYTPYVLIAAALIGGLGFAVDSLFEGWGEWLLVAGGIPLILIALLLVLSFLVSVFVGLVDLLLSFLAMPFALPFGIDLAINIPFLDVQLESKPSWRHFDEYISTWHRSSHWRPRSEMPLRKP